ncbi:MAG TPA: tetraacyldisaccharide 4'-kinase [Anaeromyxobacteraceae bacterium]|nr:tetraacyldisaccharide 4'-kinase [Anaeromyxobacteraceae bacterium]
MSLVEALWWDPAPPPARRALLSPLLLAEGLFRAGAALRGALFDRGVLAGERPAAPVISVGNLAVGGAGKTPAGLAIAGRLLDRGRAVAILSRGYGALRRDPRVVADGRSVLLSAAEGGDEPVLAARRLPGVRVLCGPRRAALARTAVEALGADVLVLDDGFQHRALARDLDVVVLDASNPFGNGHLLPRGPNREPPSALRRAGLVWLSGADRAGEGALARLRRMAREATGRDPVESRHRVLDVLDAALARSLGRDALRGRRVLALSGLARPGSFRATLEGLGAEVARERAFPDHHRFTDAEVEEALREAAGAGCDAVATTEKDAVRLPAGATDPRIAVVRIEAEIVAGADGLAAALERALAAGDARRASRPAAGPAAISAPTGGRR